MNENTLSNGSPNGSRIAQAQAGLLPDQDQSRHNAQVAAQQHNAPIMGLIKLEQRREEICASLLPQLVINLCSQGIDADSIDEQVDVARAAINEILDDAHHVKNQSLSELKTLLHPEGGSFTSVRSANQ